MCRLFSGVVEAEKVSILERCPLLHRKRVHIREVFCMLQGASQYVSAKHTKDQ